MDENMKIRELVYENLPEPLKGLTNLFEGRERDVVLLSCLGVLSGCLPKVYGIYGGKKVYANMYIMIIAPPASGKGSINYSIGLIEEIHNKVLNESLKIAEECKNNKEKDDGDCPGLKIKIIPGNISSSQIYSSLADSHYGSIIIESEADTITNAIKQDWGNFSDVLRKTFHHETISISRKKDNFYLEIKEPKLSMVLSGTPDQIKPLVQSKENGLFSRFLFFYFNESGGWNNVFDVKQDLTVEFRRVGKDITCPLYAMLFQNINEIEFNYSESQISGFNRLMSRITEAVIEKHADGFVSNVRRHGLILFRISMVLTVIRNYSDGTLDINEPIISNDIDFEIACSITENLLRHALQIYNDISETLLSQEDDTLLFALKETFTRKEAIKIADGIGMSERTMDDKLKQWRRKKAIRKIKHGVYKRVLG